MPNTQRPPDLTQSAPLDDPTTLSVSALEDHLGFWLRRVSNQVSARFTREVEAHGVSVSDWVALRRLYPDAEVSPSALVESLGMTKGAVSKVIDRLEARGLAVRGRRGDDRRQQQVSLTAEGRALVVTLARLADENDAVFFGHLPPDAHAALMSALRGLCATHGLVAVPIH
ncbi:MarR family winged helix-turn-helix transcriptional regulator [Myxococcota bacterium]|nr:MarR family winged helix-turn-helix transcriptional regulator [Myxococcota bacterium]